MEKIVSNNDCKSCRKATKPKEQQTWFAGILMVILPKCPFCVFAYSSTVMLCGKDSVISTTSHHFSETTLWVTVVLCLVTVTSILLNRRDKRTVYAAGFALVGSSMAISSVLLAGGEGLYYAGVLLIFTGVWLNGSLLYVIGRIRNKILSTAFR